MVVAPTFYASQLLTCYDYELIVYMDDILIASFMDEDRTQGLFDLLNLTIGVNGDELETTMQIEVFDLEEQDHDAIVKILNDHVNKMTAGDLLRKLNK